MKGAPPEGGGLDAAPSREKGSGKEDLSAPSGEEEDNTEGNNDGRSPSGGKRTVTKGSPVDIKGEFWSNGRVGRTGFGNRVGTELGTELGTKAETRGCKFGNHADQVVKGSWRSL